MSCCDWMMGTAGAILVVYCCVVLCVYAHVCACRLRCCSSSVRQGTQVTRQGGEPPPPPRGCRVMAGWCIERSCQVWQVDVSQQSSAPILGTGRITPPYPRQNHISTWVWLDPHVGWVGGGDARGGGGGRSAAINIYITNETRRAYVSVP